MCDNVTDITGILKKKKDKAEINARIEELEELWAEIDDAIELAEDTLEQMELDDIEDDEINARLDKDLEEQDDE